MAFLFWNTHQDSFNSTQCLVKMTATVVWKYVCLICSNITQQSDAFLPLNLWRSCFNSVYHITFNCLCWVNGCHFFFYKEPVDMLLCHFFSFTFPPTFPTKNLHSQPASQWNEHKSGNWKWGWNNFPKIGFPQHTLSYSHTATAWEALMFSKKKPHRLSLGDFGLHFKKNSGTQLGGQYRSEGGK